MAYRTMNKPDVIYLVDESPAAHGVFDPDTETKSMRFAVIKSVGYNEFYAAKSAGVNPSIIFVLSDYADYDGQKIIEHNNKRYRVVRTYCVNQRIEITCEEATNDRT